MQEGGINLNLNEDEIKKRMKLKDFSIKLSKLSNHLVEKPNYEKCDLSWNGEMHKVKFHTVSEMVEGPSNDNSKFPLKTKRKKVISGVLKVDWMSGRKMRRFGNARKQRKVNQLIEESQNDENTTNSENSESNNLYNEINWEENLDYDASALVDEFAPRVQQEVPTSSKAVEEEPENSEQILQASTTDDTFVEGDVLFVKDFHTSEWKSVSIIEVDCEDNEVLVHYKDKSKCDEWVSMNSQRLSRTKPTYPRFEIVDCDGCVIVTGDIAEEIGIDESNFHQFLQRHGVLLKEKMCPHCGFLCVTDLPRMSFRCNRRRIVDGVRVRCSYKLSLKSNSWLERSRLPFRKVCELVSMWLTSPHLRVSSMVSDLHMSKSVLVDWCNFCREICINSLLLAEHSVLGGPGMVVEIDEAEFGKRKDNMGREIAGSWIFGCFERESKRSFFVPVQDRSAATLIDVILHHIAPGTTIISDRWRGHDALINHPQFVHLTVNLSFNFVDPVTGAHTQNIERMWREVRNNIPRQGRAPHHMVGYLAEFYWKAKVPRNERLHKFLIEIARQYDPTRNIED